MPRTRLGILALLLLAVGGGGELFLGADSSGHTLTGMALRIGILLAVIWLALPDVQKLPPWAGAIVLGGGVLAYYLSGRLKILLPLAFAALVALLFLRPRLKTPKKNLPSKSSQTPEKKT